MRRPGIWVANGSPSDPAKMLSWRPGALTAFFDYLGPNRVLPYKQQHPEAVVIVRFQHPHNWQEDIGASARRLSDMVISKWPEIRDLDAYVYFCNEMNLHYENGDPNPGNQPRYETPEFYRRYADWVRIVADRIKQKYPQMKLVTPPFAFGHHEDGAPDDYGNPTEGWAGYDYLADTVRSHFNNIITFHAYWGHAGGSVRDWLYDPRLSSWYAFRWRRVLKLFEQRYGIQAKVIIDEAGNFGASDHDFTEQVIYYARQTLADPRVIALTFFLWQDPTRSPGNLPNSWVDRCRNLDNHVARLAAMPDVEIAPLQPSPPGKAIRVLMPDKTVRVMELEEYLRGVVAAEMPHTWPLEALKAQAVAARSYAMAAIARPRHHPEADVCTTTHCQAYNEARINSNCDLAVRQTRGQVILYNNQLATAYYCANCGGHTLGNETVWGGPPLPYLRPVPCINPGPKKGHGVGMCQWGAHDMAMRGDNYEAILKHYYTGIRLSSEPETPPTPQPVTEGGEIYGKVTDAQGQPVANVRVRLSRDNWGGEAVTGPDGSYRFTQLPPGTYELVVVGYDVRRSGLQLAKGQRMTLDLQLPAPAASRWEMHVERKFGLPILAGSLPRPGIEVTLKSPIGLTFKRTSGSKPQYGPGGFEFWAPNRGLYTIRFLDQTFELTLEGGFTLVTFTETSSAPANKGIIRGQLRDQKGTPVAGRQVTLRDGGVSRTTITGADGSFQFDALAAGSYTLSVPDAGVTQTVQNDGRSTTTVALTLPAAPPEPPQPTAQWMMKVTRAPGMALIAGTLPEAGITLTITPPAGQPIRVVSGSWPSLGVGGFRVPALYRGVYTIQFLDQTFKLPVDGQYTLLTFVRTAPVGSPADTQSADAAVRLVSSPMPRAAAEELLSHLEADPQARGHFEMERL